MSKAYVAELLKDQGAGRGQLFMPFWRGRPIKLTGNIQKMDHVGGKNQEAKESR